MESIYLETLGCNKNQVDSEKILYILENHGFTITSDAENADIIIINTCCFINDAKEEAIETILEYAEYKKSGKCKKLIVAGCLAQNYSNLLKEEMPEIDIVFGVGNIKKILDIIHLDNAVLIPDSLNKNEITGRKLLGFPGSAFLKISEGCNNNCSYCIIPAIRGPLKSRKMEDILKEIDFLKKQNIYEINIISQDTANYGIDIYGKKSLVDLIKKIDDNIDNNVWLRILYMHPDHIDHNLLIDLKNISSFIPYFDIPFQSGSSKILKKMNRKGTKDKYLNLINDIRNTFENPMIRSTFITGFPGETDYDFDETLDFINKSKIDWVGGFTYSKEENTIAGKMPGQIDEKIKKDRLYKIYNISEKITMNRLNRFINTKQKILIEEKVEEEDLYIGRIWAQAPEVDGLTVTNICNAECGNFIEGKITKLNGHDFFAEEE